MNPRLMNPPLPQSDNTPVIWRSFRTAAWLGWKIESNWTDPALFAIYSIIKPLAGAAILVVMYTIVTTANYSSPVFAYLYLGNAFYLYVAAVMTGVSWSIIDDREHYRTLKYIYVAPIQIPFYLLGRGVARFITCSFSVIITLVFGVLFLHVPLDLAQVNWPFFFLALSIGVVMLAFMGLSLAGLTLLLPQHSYMIGDAVAGALFLFSGAIFPLEYLPAWLRPVGYFMPITYWLELLRRTLVGSVADAFPTLSGFSNLSLLGILVGLSVVFAAASMFIFRACDRAARERGYLDITSNY